MIKNLFRDNNKVESVNKLQSILSDYLQWLATTNSPLGFSYYQ